jgi:spectinomycin phosphotransferase
MSEKPKFNESEVVNCLRSSYGIEVVRIVPIGGGADQNASVFKVEASGVEYFLKQKSNNSNDDALLVQDFLYNQDISEVLSPTKTQDKKLSVSTNHTKLVLYPFIDGFSGVEKSLSEQNWIKFGQTLKKIHSATIPQALRNSIRIENYSTRFPKALIGIFSQISEGSFIDPVTLRLVDFLKSKEKELYNLVDKTNQLCDKFKFQSKPLVLCHSDIHAGNRFVDKNGNLRIIDFDEPILAPAERDLMFIGSGIIRPDTPREIDLFYRGYEESNISQEGIAYYRNQRIIEDVVLFAEDILNNKLNTSDKERSFNYLVSNFAPGGALECANKTML